MGDYDEALAAVFQEFCSFGMGSKNTGPPLMDSRQCQKLARDCRLVDRRLTKVDVDLVFTAVKGRGEHKIDYLDFLECVRQWAERKGVSYEELCDQIANSNGPTLNQVTTPDTQKFSSPLYETATSSSAAAAATSATRGVTSPTYGGSSERRPAASASSSRGSGGLSSASRDSRSKTSAPPPPPSGSMQLHPDWYEVPNPDPQGPDELVYYVNRKTNETSWSRPVLVTPPRTSRVSGGGDSQPDSEDIDASASINSRGSGSSPYRSVFDKLTDPQLYTGSHKHRFDPETGQGLGRRGRDATTKGQGTAKDSPTSFRGFTNTGTDEVIHDISQIVIRK